MIARYHRNYFTKVNTILPSLYFRRCGFTSPVMIDRGYKGKRCKFVFLCNLGYGDNLMILLRYDDDVFPRLAKLGFAVGSEGGALCVGSEWVKTQSVSLKCCLVPT